MHTRDISHSSCCMRLTCVQRLRLLRGTASFVMRVNLHVDFILPVNLSFVTPYYLKYREIHVMFNTRLNPVTPEANGEN